MSTQVQVTPDDVKNISTKLDQFSAVLTPHEYQILLGVFAIASKALKDMIAAQAPSGGQAPAPALPPLSAGFQDAFAPGTKTTFTLDSSDSEAATEGTTIKGSIGIDHTS